MTTIEITYLIVLLVIIVVALMYIQKLLAQIEMLKMKNGAKKDNSQLILAAYERLSLFTERTKIENLVSKFNQSEYTSKQMAQMMVGAIKEEYEYNTSQQVYVSERIWEAIQKMKEQNIYIVHQVLQATGHEESSASFAKNLLTVVNASETATMNTLVLNAIQQEAKQIL